MVWYSEYRVVFIGHDETRNWSHLHPKEECCSKQGEINSRALIGQSAMGHCAGKPMEKSRLFWMRLVIYKFFSCSTNTLRGLSAYNP